MKLDPDLRDMYLDVWVCDCGTFIPVKKGNPKPKCEVCLRKKCHL